MQVASRQLSKEPRGCGNCPELDRRPPSRQRQNNPGCEADLGQHLSLREPRWVSETQEKHKRNTGVTRPSGYQEMHQLAWPVASPFLPCLSFACCLTARLLSGLLARGLWRFMGTRAARVGLKVGFRTWKFLECFMAPKPEVEKRHMHAELLHA